MIKRLNEILDNLNGEEKIILSVAAAEDKEVLQAIKDAVEKDIIEPILIGDENKIKLLSGDIGFNLSGIKIINSLIYNQVLIQKKSFNIINTMKLIL